MDSRRIKGLLEALNKTDELQKTGLNIVKDALRRAGEVEQGIKPAKFAVSLVFKKGDIMPKSFWGLPNIKIDRNGVLLEDWEDGWCQSQWNESGGWGNTWGECWDNTGPSALSGGIIYGNPVEWVKKPIELTDFTNQEIEILKNYKIVR